MKALALVVLLAVAAGCAQRPAPQPAKINSPEEAESLVVLVDRTGQSARDLVHDVAVRCWLDGVVQGAQLIVKPSGNIEIVGDRDLLVAADYLAQQGPRTRWKLTGTALRDPVQRERLVETLDEAGRTGRTACPRIAS